MVEELCGGGSLGDTVALARTKTSEARWSEASVGSNGVLASFSPH
jgi:hypothetical protein